MRKLQWEALRWEVGAANKKIVVKVLLEKRFL